MQRKSLVDFLLLGEEDVVEGVRLQGIGIAFPSATTQVLAEGGDVIVLRLRRGGGAEDVVVWEFAEGTFVVQAEVVGERFWGNGGGEVQCIVVVEVVVAFGVHSCCCFCCCWGGEGEGGEQGQPVARRDGEHHDHHRLRRACRRDGGRGGGVPAVQEAGEEMDNKRGRRPLISECS